jgi:hypothetical protein
MNIRSKIDYVVVAAGALSILIYFHASYIEIHDDGVFAYVAQRLLNGAVLNRDVLSFHSGFLHFIHVIAFRFFGVDFVSLRYPLMLSAFLQVMIVYTIFRGRGVAFALASSLLALSTSCILYNNPTGNWYTQLCFWFLCLILSKMPAEQRLRYVCSGMVLGACFLFRQLTFAFLSLGYLSFLAGESQKRDKQGVRGRHSTGIMLARGGLFCAGLPFVVYALSGANPDGILLFCLMPLLLHFSLALRAQMRIFPLLGRAVLTISGMGMVLVPFVLYIAINYDLGLWLEQTFVKPFALHEAEFKKRMLFLWLPFFGVQEIVANPFSPVIILNSVIWSVLPFASLFLGIVLFRFRGRLRMEPLPVLALSYGIVAVHYEIPIYLIFTLAPTLTALLFLSDSKFKRRNTMVALAVSAVLLYYHAGQPQERGVLGILRGTRLPSEACDFPHCSLRVGHEVNVRYAKLYQILRPLLAGGASFYAFPYNPELFFLLDVPPHMGGYHFVMDVRSREELDHLIRVFDEDPPKVIVVDMTDKAVDGYAHELWSRIANRYEHIGQVDTVEVLRLRGR